jgi:hypothetical protein
MKTEKTTEVNRSKKKYMICFGIGIVQKVNQIFHTEISVAILVEISAVIL